MSIIWFNSEIILAEIRCDSSVKEELNAVLGMVRNRGGDVDVVVDFSEVLSGINSRCFDVIQELKELLDSKERRLLICSANDEVMKPFIRTGLVANFSFFDSRHLALIELQRTETHK